MINAVGLAANATSMRQPYMHHLKLNGKDTMLKNETWIAST